MGWEVHRQHLMFLGSSSDPRAVDVREKMQHLCKAMLVFLVLGASSQRLRLENTDFQVVY